MKKLLIMTLLISVLSARSAGAVDLQWTGQVGIIQLYPYATGLIVEVDTSVNPANTCPARLFVALSQTNYEVYSGVLISAFHAEKRVNFVIDMDDLNCGSSIDRFAVYK